MRNTITLNGIASTTIAGLLIQELPAISKPLMRTTIEEIDGRDGDIVTELGYSAYDKEITIGLYGSFDINAVIAYFATEGTVVFSNEPDKFYRYKIIDQIDYERLVRYRTATVKLHCQPFKYPTSETPVQLGSGQTITAEGTDLTMQGTALAPFVSITPKGDTYQITTTGKNLTQTPYANQKSEHGITMTLNNDYTLTLNGQNDNAAASIYYFKKSTTQDFPLAAGTYYMLTPQNSAIRFVIYDGNTYYTMTSGSGYSCTIPSDTYVVQFYLEVYKGTGGTFDNVKVLPMLSTTPDLTEADYEPYTGRIPAPNPQYPQAVKTVTRDETVNLNALQLITKEGVATPSTDTDFWTVFQRFTTEPLGNGWARFTNVANSDYANFWIRDTAVENFKTNSTYTLIFEIKNVTSTTGTLTLLSVTNAGDPFNTRQMIHGTSPSSGLDVWLRGSETQSLLVAKVTTDADSLHGRALRAFTSPSTPYGAQFDIRVTYLEGDHTSDWQNFCGANYQPYGSQKYELNFGKNLLNPNDLVTGYVMTDGTLSTSAGTGDKATQSFIPVQPSSKVTFTIFETTSTYDPWFGLCEYSQANEASFISPRQVNQTAGITSATFTIGPNTRYIRVSARNMAAATKYQLEYGDKTTYAPYKTPMELCKIGTYQDYIYKSGDKWYKHTEIAKATLPTSGYTRWSTQPTACMYYKNGALSDALLQKGIVTAVIENLPVMPQVGNMTEYYNAYAQTSQYGFVLKVDTPGIMVQNTDCAALADFHTWISENPVEVRYVLATATNTQITDTELIEQLKALKGANSYRYVTKLNTAGDGYNMPVIIAATATGEADGTVTNAGNTYAKPKLTIYGTGNIGIYLNGNQMFQIELGSEGHITIDTEKMEAYKDSESNLKNRLVTGDYSKFRLEAGANQINFSGNINKCVVENYTRWL